MIGAKVVRHARSVIFQIAGLAVLWEKSELILRGGSYRLSWNGLRVNMRLEDAHE